MTDSHPLFRAIWRLNALILLVLMTALGAFASYQIARELLRSRQSYGGPGASIATRVTGSPTPGETGRPAETLLVGLFSTAAADVFQAPLYSGGGGRAETSYKFGSGSLIRNVLFFDARDGSVRRLFPNDRGRVLEQDAISRTLGKPNTQELAARVYVYAPADSNGDGEVDFKDEKRVILTRPDGTDPVVLADRIDSYGADPAADREVPVLSYFVRRGPDLTFAEFDLVAFASKRQRPVKVPQL